MRQAVEKGLAFLRERQSAEGFWEDWQLPVGSSRMWTTAYVGWRLASSDCTSGEMLERAAEWLESSELDEGGWGYAESTGADADSTALAIAFLCAMRRRVAMTAIRRLLRFVGEDGGFATFNLEQSFGAWTASQVEVTAAAILALTMTDEAPGVVDRARQYLCKRQRSDGLWESYWWMSPLYATEIVVRALGTNARIQAASGVRALKPSNPFEMALQLMIAPDDLASLAITQNHDGSWPSAPILRLASRDVFEPWKQQHSGPCFADHGRIFTTATAVSAVAEGSRQQPPSVS